MAQRNRDRQLGPDRNTTSARSTAADTGRHGTLSRRPMSRDFPTWQDPITGWTSDPLGQFRHWSQQMERWFNSFGLGASGNRTGDWNLSAGGQMQTWMPQIEAYQRGDELVVRADLPGLKREDVTVEITDDAVVIQGERRDEFESEREGYYRSERSYGSFYRAVPLPAGAITEDAKATFKDGVLEVTMPAPPATTRGRQIDIRDGSEHTTHGAGVKSRSGARTAHTPRLESEVE